MDRGNIKEVGIPSRVSSASTQMVIADKSKIRGSGYIRHPVLSVGSFIPEMENKSQELACQNMLRDFLNLLLNGHA